ncbi:restriction endonuclease subunit S [Pseudomonas sp. TMW22090]|uniref:restriction endonuclease subunit S n=1 Tax=Pseudomonas sp. TMW22090 TaxID=2506434 RepID=UPI001F0EAAD4|nr:restriction endonuclease subunit S [Pseudomonas sp. TMW22090]MCH4881237.1 restriction endonuclease subunit S [Pseudomonas sp. TMW22090]
MSSVNFMEKLLDGVAVEWVTLGSVADIGTGSSNRQDESETGIYPFYVRSKNVLKSDTFEFDEVAIIIPGEGGIGEIFHYVEGKYSLHQRAYRIRVKSDVVSTKFLYYFMSSSFKQYILMKSVGSTTSSIRKPMLEGFQVPIPCPENPIKSLEIQAEIVRILDAFIELIAEVKAKLTAELTIRKIQYMHYRDELMSFKEGEVEWKALGEIGEFIRGKRFTKADFVEDGISVIHYGEIYTRYGAFATRAFSQVRNDMAGSLRYAEPGDVVITDVGETVEDVGKAVAWLGDEKVAIHDHCYAFRHSMDPKFVSYCMKTTSFIADKAKYIARTKVNTLLINGFSKIKIPVPYPSDPDRSLAEQIRIVSILDRFDALTNSLAESLPREIALHQKQYAHYRDLLLNFPKLDKVAA